MNKQNKVYLNFTISDITQLLKRREKNIFLFFIEKLYPKATVYIGVAKFNRAYLLHMIIHSFEKIKPWFY